MPEHAALSIAPVETTEDLAALARLFRDYAGSLDVDLAYQDFEGELAALPGKYAPPSGALLLAKDAAGAAIGCAALRALEPPGCCEMKRLYVSPAARGLGLGGRLVEAVIATAERLGYREIRLDTLPSMTAAQALYRKLGFEPMPHYYDTPIAGTEFMRRSLGGRRG